MNLRSAGSLLRRAAIAKTTQHTARLHQQLTHLGQKTRQHLAFFLPTLGEKMMCFDRAQHRLHLLQCFVHTRQAQTLFELAQGAAAALRQAA